MKRSISRYIAPLLAAGIVVTALAGCGNNVVSGTGTFELQQNSSVSSEDTYPGEFPSADQSLPAGEGAALEISSSSLMSSMEATSSESSSEAVTQSQAEDSSSRQPVTSTQVVPQPEPVLPSSQAPVVSQPAASSEADQTAYTRPNNSVDEVRGIWISYLDFHAMARDQNRSSFTSNIDNAFSTIADYDLNTVFVQVRPFGDAMYESKIFPWSYILTGDEGIDPGYDPLEIMVTIAKKYDLRIEAWLNPYRVLAVGSTRELSSSNPAVQAIKKGKDTAISYNGGIFYNPASNSARALITQGVVELVENYDIDGIHFDDYFYPTVDMAFDANYYSDYCAQGGELSQADWRRENVNTLVRQVYAAVKAADPSVLFGISPQARMDNNYNGQFADVEKWLSNSGYVDYICPQIYYGYDNAAAPYASTLALWSKMCRSSDVALYVGLAVYKCGVADKWAGGGENEWINSTTMMRDMVEEARDASGYQGFLLYRYDSLFNPEHAVSSHIAKESANLKSVL
ncbi:MAG: glycoside hydrolase family 10 protein [Candidatus Fimivivens sp.]